MGLPETPLDLDESGSDRPKVTLNPPVFVDGELPMVEDLASLRLSLEQGGTSVEAFKELPAYRLALESRRYPWLAGL